MLNPLNHPYIFRFIVAIIFILLCVFYVYIFCEICGSIIYHQQVSKPQITQIATDFLEFFCENL